MTKFIVLSVLVLITLASLCVAAPKSSDKLNPEKPVEKIKSTTATPVTSKPLPPKRKHKETFVEVAYGKEKVSVGNFLDPIQVKDVPVPEWKTEPDTLYTLLMIDIDAPKRSNPVDADYVHWLTGNIPGNDLSKGTLIAEYVGAFPANGTGIHNHMFMLYEQPEGRIEFTEKFISKTNNVDRKNFDVAAFVKKYGFNNPISFNLFKAEYDPHSDVIRAQFIDPEMEKKEDMKEDLKKDMKEAMKVETKEEAKEEDKVEVVKPEKKKMKEMESEAKKPEENKKQ